MHSSKHVSGADSIRGCKSITNHALQEDEEAYHDLIATACTIFFTGGALRNLRMRCLEDHAFWLSWPALASVALCTRLETLNIDIPYDVTPECLGGMFYTLKHLKVHRQGTEVPASDRNRSLDRPSATLTSELSKITLAPCKLHLADHRDMFGRC